MNTPLPAPRPGSSALPPRPPMPPPLPLERETVVRWLIEELPSTLCLDPAKSRMPMDTIAVTNLFGQHLDAMFASGTPDATRFTRCWGTMSKALEGVPGQEGLPTMTLDLMEKWGRDNPLLPPPLPPPPPGQQVDFNALMGGPGPAPLPPPDLNPPPPPPDSLFGPLTSSPQIPPPPAIPGDGQISSPPAGFAPIAPTQTMSQDTGQPQIDDPYEDRSPPKVTKTSKWKIALVVFLGVLFTTFIVVGVVMVVNNKATIARKIAEFKPKPEAPKAPAPAQPAPTTPVATAQPAPAPVKPTEPAKLISARCNYQIETFGLENCAWIKGPGPFQCDIGSVDGKAAAKCGDFQYTGTDLPDMPQTGIIVEMRR